MPHRRERTIILAALFIALSVALGYALAEIPNVELMTLTVFVAGAFCGWGLGSLVGGLSILFFSLLNPLGPAPAPLLAAQVAGFAVTGAVGGVVGPRIAPITWRGAAVSAAMGFLLTLFYDVITTLATAFIALGVDRFAGGLAGVFLVGTAFVAWHVGINTAVFAAAVPPILRGARAWERGGTR